MTLHLETKTLLPLTLILPFIILVEGFVSIAVEILTIRQLLPVAGGSVLVTSIIIGIFLLFLALGYQRGGRLLTHPQQVLRRNFFISALWLGIGLSYLFVALFFQFIEKIMGPPIIYPLIAYLLLIIAPLTYLLGQTIPITMNMVKQNQSAGVIGGSALSLSTIGSFFGATLTTLVLMYYFGVAWTIFINFILLSLLVLALAEKYTDIVITIVFSIACAWLIYLANVAIENQSFVLTNSYANYQILDSSNSSLHPGEKILMINDSASSYIDQKNKSSPYIEAIKKILFYDLKLRHADILVLGAGGFSLSAENVFNNRLTYVDIDPQIKSVSQHYFTPSAPQHLIADDARHYLKNTKQLFQAIVVDVYSDVKTIPSHLLTREYMADIQKRLAPNGIVIFNIIANPLLADPYSKHIDNTIRFVFKNCMAIPHHYSNQVVNILYTCSIAETSNDNNVYSDNINHSTTDSFFW